MSDARQKTVQRLALDWRGKMHREEQDRRAREKLEFWLSQVRDHGDTCTCMYCYEIAEFVRSVP